MLFQRIFSWSFAFSRFYIPFTCVDVSLNDSVIVSFFIPSALMTALMSSSFWHALIRRSLSTLIVVFLSFLCVLELIRQHAQLRILISNHTVTGPDRTSQQPTQRRHKGEPRVTSMSYLHCVTDPTREYRYRVARTDLVVERDLGWLTHLITGIKRHSSKF